jgi:nucleoside-diphosphate-sugar epimerase
VTGHLSHQTATVMGQESHHRQESPINVFVTGGTGLVGSAVVAELLSNGHTVLALTRSDASAQAAELAGATAILGGLTDLATLRSGAARADGVIHLAFSNDFSSPEALATGIAEESAALLALGEALLGSDRPLVTVSGTPHVVGRASTETDPLPTVGPVAGRGRTVTAILELASRGVRSTAVRLPRTVHNQGTGGFAGLLTNIARRRGVSGYPGDGTQRWPAVNALDAAVLFRLALETAPAGTSWHAVSDEGDAVRDIADVIGRRLGLPIESVPEEAFGPLGPIFATDQPASSAHTRQALGWAPTHVGLLRDLESIQA